MRLKWLKMWATCGREITLSFNLYEFIGLTWMVWFLSFFKSSFWFVSLRYKLGRRGKISCDLRGGVSANLFPLKPSNSGNRIFATKKTMMLNKSLSPEMKIIISAGRSLDIQKYYQDFPGRTITTRVWMSAPAQDPCCNNNNIDNMIASYCNLMEFIYLVVNLE